MSTKGHNSAIARAMEFTANDLTLNQRGELSPQQHQKLVVMRDLFIQDIAEAPPLHMPSVITLIMIGACAALLSLVGVFNRLQQGLGAGYLPLLIGVSLFILGSFLWKQFRYWAVRSFLPDMIEEMIQTPALYSVRGEAHLDIEESPAETNYWLRIADQHFPLTTSAADVFQEGRTYRVFYVHFADTTVLMSAEWLNDNNL